MCVMYWDDRGMREKKCIICKITSITETIDSCTQRNLRGLHVIDQRVPFHPAQITCYNA